jgi:hypothetical protein
MRKKNKSSLAGRLFSVCPIFRAEAGPESSPWCFGFGSISSRLSWRRHDQPEARRNQAPRLRSG